LSGEDIDDDLGTDKVTDLQENPSDRVNILIITQINSNKN
jgi:hypothetical protein